MHRVGLRTPVIASLMGRAASAVIATSPRLRVNTALPPFGRIDFHSKSSPARGRWHAEGMTEGEDTKPKWSLTSPSVTASPRHLPLAGEEFLQALKVASTEPL
jgi:hypothetical protein